MNPTLAVKDKRMAKAILLISLTIGVALISTSALTSQAGMSEPAPVLAARSSICRPMLTVDGKSYQAGTAFIITGKQPMVLTAQHLFGPDGGLKEAVPWNEMPKRARISCRSTAGGDWPTDPALAISGAHGMNTGDQSSLLNDVAAFPVSASAALAGLSLATAPPKVGSKVWLVAEVENSRTLIHSATVLGFESGAMAFAYDEPKIELRATSGAPIVDDAGKVVGINLGGGYDTEAKAVVGIADDLSIIQKALAGKN